MGFDFWSSPAAMEHVAKQEAIANDAIRTGNLWIEYARGLEGQLEEYKSQLNLVTQELIIEKCHAAGACAQAIGLKQKMLELRDPTGVLEGGNDSEFSKMYDKAFCEKGAEIGLENPDRYIR